MLEEATGSDDVSHLAASSSSLARTLTMGVAVIWQQEWGKEWSCQQDRIPLIVSQRLNATKIVAQRECTYRIMWSKTQNAVPTWIFHPWLCLWYVSLFHWFDFRNISHFLSVQKQYTCSWLEVKFCIITDYPNSFSKFVNLKINGPNKFYICYIR